jgi:hypothetical protein
MLFQIIPAMRLQRRRKFRIETWSLLASARFNAARAASLSLSTLNTVMPVSDNSGPWTHEHNRYAFDGGTNRRDHPAPTKAQKNGDKVLAADVSTHSLQSEIATNACVLIANSIGSARSTSLANLLTISATASSPAPRDRHRTSGRRQSWTSSPHAHHAMNCSSPRYTEIGVRAA